jgi:glycosyltransferase involved in cell wall biosynthesis
MPNVSIAMTSFNGARYIQEQLDSIVSQTIPPAEIIISDDCSTDNTREIVSSYTLKESRIILLKNTQTLGFVKNFEKAISRCSEDYIALADQDDIWEPGKLEKLLANIGSSALIHSDASVIDSAGNNIHPSWSSFYKKNIGQPLLDHIMQKNTITGCTTLFTRDLASLLLPFPEEVPFHDWWLALVAYRNGGISYCAEPLVRYRLHSANAIGAGHTGLSRTRQLQQNVRYYTFLLSRKDLLKLTADEENILRMLIGFYSNKLAHRVCLSNIPEAYTHHALLFGQSKVRIRNLLSAALGTWGKP